VLKDSSGGSMGAVPNLTREAVRSVVFGGWSRADLAGLHSRRSSCCSRLLRGFVLTGVSLALPAIVGGGFAADQDPAARVHAARPTAGGPLVVEMCPANAVAKVLSGLAP
jgi:hypothetical protein